MIRKMLYIIFRILRMQDKERERIEEQLNKDVRQEEDRRFYAMQKFRSRQAAVEDERREPLKREKRVQPSGMHR